MDQIRKRKSGRVPNAPNVVDPDADLRDGAASSACGPDAWRGEGGEAPEGLELVGSGGCVRQDSTGRGRPDLISPFAEQRIAALVEWGVKHRGNRNWERGCPYSRCVESMQRHLTAFKAGKPDEEHDDNLAAICFWAMAMMHFDEMIKRGILPESLNDLPDYNGTYEEFIASIDKVIMAKDAEKNSSDVEVRRHTYRPDCLDKIVGAPLKIYVAGPISSDTEEGLANNYRIGNETGDAIQAMGHMPFVPHRYETPSEDNKSQVTYEQLMALDFSLIKKWADALYVIAQSPGTNREIALAKELGIPIYWNMDQIPRLLPKTERFPTKGR